MCVAGLEFHGENFRGWLKNREIRESFLPRKFPVIRYEREIIEMCILKFIHSAFSTAKFKALYDVGFAYPNCPQKYIPSFIHLFLGNEINLYWYMR